MPHRLPRTRRLLTRGFSLLEVTLVLALLVMVAAIVWPAFERPLATERLRRGADKVRAEWTRARLRAMTSGTPHVFRYQPQTNIFQVEAWYDAQSQVEAGSVSDFGIPLQPAVVTVGVGDKGLPEGVVFDTDQTLLDLRTMYMGTGVASPTSEAAWSQPIYFFPDGTTSTATLLLRNEYEQYIRLDLRALTGVTTVSDVLGADEIIVP